MGILIAVLFILLMICFYFIALLNMKLNRFQKNEHKQELMMEEMESSLANFLTEIEDENNKLIQIINSNNQNNHREVVQVPIEKEDEPTQEDVASVKQEHHERKEEKVVFAAPRSYVKKAYASEPKVATVEVPKVELTIEQQVKELYKKGQSIAEIAKQMNKGKTEVELLLKFQNNK